jgi:Fibronectin type III domain
MRRLVGAIAVLGCVAVALAGGPAREVKTRRVVEGAPLPVDLVAPEGKSRWHLETLTLGAASTGTIVNEESGPVLEVKSGGKAVKSLLSGADPERWLLPDRDPSQMKMGARVDLAFSETRDGLADRVVAHVSTIGIGWIHLPSGPKEAVLQKVLLLRQRAGERAMSPDVLIHRWVSTLEGIVAEVSGPASSDGTKRLSIDRVEVLDSIVAGAADLKIYSDQIYRSTFTDIKYGYDRGVGTTPQSLVPNPGIANACDLVNLTTWNFSGVNSGTETASTQVTSIPSESCNTARCGYQGYPPSGTLDPPILERLDRLTGSLRRDNQVVQWEDRAADRTLWLRAGAQNENVSGAFGTGETRFCFTDEVGKNRAEVPLWQMTHSDANGFYAQLGDSWGSTPVPTGGCQESFYTLVCGATQPFTPNPNYGQACTSGGQTHNGQQTGKLVNAGVVITPSGHTLNSLVVRNTTDFCIYTGSSCGFVLDRVRTIVYYWQVPYLGSVALIRGPRKVDYAAGEVGETPCTNFTTLDFTDMAYGLFPPVSITAGATTDTTLSLSWNPGNDVHRINGYKIYWDTDPGSSTNYAFNSVTNAGQVSIVGTTVTISGLTPGTPYYVTVTSLSNFTDPSSSVVTPYESIRYPTTVSGDPSFSYPVEVTATTTGGTCIPAQPVTGLTVDKAGANAHVCWTATSDACALGYDILGSNNAANDAGWSVVGQVGLTTCWDGDPARTYLLVRARGTGGNGPWGHYNH